MMSLWDSRSAIRAGEKCANLTSTSQIIYSTVRVITPKELEWYTEECISLKSEFPHLICGTYMLFLRHPLAIEVVLR